MFNKIASLILLVCFVFLPAASANTALPKAVDYLILGGTIVTMDDARTIIRDGGIAVKDGKIVSVGTRTEVSRNFRP
ncbi:hypothetical protein OFC08_32015, partial [Escherichia coli]|nr:hypothetical protein [Escherichia coli]